MTKQIGLYLTPTDVDNLLQTINQHVGLKLLSATSTERYAVETNTPLLKPSPILARAKSSHVQCYLAPAESTFVQMRYSSVLQLWHLNPEPSEVIEFSGCDYDDVLLLRGRFYYMLDTLRGEALVQKSDSFKKWANQVFKISKEMLNRSKAAYAYIGDDAVRWKSEGGRLASFLVPGRNPIYEDNI